eukprot:6213654-Pleurochrysis_carterae.AAC.2
MDESEAVFHIAFIITQEFKDCYMQNNGRKLACAEFKEDYLECLHHNKEVRAKSAASCVQSTVPRESHKPLLRKLCWHAAVLARNEAGKLLATQLSCLLHNHFDSALGGFAFAHVEIVMHDVV